MTKISRFFSPWMMAEDKNMTEHCCTFPQLVSSKPKVPKSLREVWINDNIPHSIDQGCPSMLDFATGL